MSSTVDKNSTRRSRDSDASRSALLQAAREGFDELGYDLATTREIGERAGVDPALIARYFDSKEGLFLAAIAAGEEEQLDYDPGALLAFLFERWDERGHSPISRALASPALSDDVRLQVRELIGERLIGGLSRELDARGVADSE